MRNYVPPLVLWLLCGGLWLVLIVDRTECRDISVSVREKVHPVESVDEQGQAPVPAGEKLPPSSQCININNALPDQLIALPGIGPVIAGRIVAFRNENGPFQELGDVDRVKGIGPATLRKLEGKICFGDK